MSDDRVLDTFFSRAYPDPREEKKIYTLLSPRCSARRSTSWTQFYEHSRIAFGAPDD